MCKNIIKILNTSSDKWNKYIDKLPIKYRDIYYYSEYYKLYEANGDGEGKLFIYEEEDRLALYPFLLRKIEGYELDDEYYDIETAYGYGGPISNCKDDDFINRFEIKFIRFCKDNNIIAEFIRYHPLLKNQDLFRENIDIKLNRKTIVINLINDIEYIWNNVISSKNRNMIRKSTKNKLSISLDYDTDNFRKIYNTTMNRVHADDKYYFFDNYYTLLRDINSININVLLKNNCISSSIFIYKGYYIHYHLSGSLEKYLSYAPNNFMLWEAIKIAKKNNFRYFHLGGGITQSLDDSLFRFKKSFSEDILDFYIGTRIHNSKIYDRLIYDWKIINNKEQKFFLQYRM